MIKRAFTFIEDFFGSLNGQPLPWQIIVMLIMALSYFPLYFILNWPTYLYADRMMTFSGAPGHFRFNNMMFYLHILTALPPLLIGPWMFHEKFRNNHIKWHRKLGEVYVYCCLLSAMTALPLSLRHFTGLIPSLGFSSLAIAWYSFTCMAFLKAIQKDFVAHRKWMMRSYACTLAFVNVKIYSIVMVLFQLNLHPLTIKVMQSCISWTSNLFIAEIYLAATTFKGQRVTWKMFKKRLTRF